MTEISEHPPQIDSYQVTHSTTLRFIAVAAFTNTVITFENLMDTMLVADTAIHGYNLFDAVKLKSVRIWSQAAVGTSSTVEVQFATASGDADIHTDTSLGVRPAFIHAKPSQKSLTSLWNINSGTSAMTITGGAGAIIDVKLVFRTSDKNPVAELNALVAATIGEFYWRGLDGLAIAGTNFTPPTGVQSR